MRGAMVTALLTLALPAWPQTLEQVLLPPPAELQPPEPSLLASIDRVRESQGAYSVQAIEPLVALADLYQRAGDHIAALSMYAEARVVHRRVFGLLSEGEIAILDAMTASLESVHRIDEAHERQRAALELAERNRGQHSLELLPALYKYATWLRSHGGHALERLQYQRIRWIVEEHYGEDSIHMVRPLLDIANSYREQRLPSNLGMQALRRALEILESRRAGDPLAIAKTLRDIGDWHAAFQGGGAKGDEYLRAWELLGRIESGEALRAQWFQRPRCVLCEPPNAAGTVSEQARERAEAGFVLVEFDVDTRGRAHNIHVVESHPAGFKDESVVQAIGRSRFRPQIVDGELAPAADVARRYTFLFEPGGRRSSG